MKLHEPPELIRPRDALRQPWPSRLERTLAGLKARSNSLHDVLAEGKSTANRAGCRDNGPQNLERLAIRRKIDRWCVAVRRLHNQVGTQRIAVQNASLAGADELLHRDG